MGPYTENSRGPQQSLGAYAPRPLGKSTPDRISGSVMQLNDLRKDPILISHHKMLTMVSHFLKKKDIKKGTLRRNFLKSYQWECNATK